MKELFGAYAHEIVFLHVLSAFIWVGGMIAIRFAVHPNMQLIDDPKVKLGRTLSIMGKFFHMALPFIFLILITGLVMVIAADGHHSEQKFSFIGKESIWVIMVMNFTWMYLKRRRAQRLFDAGSLPEAKATTALIPKLLLPVNIILGIIALWFGVTLRGL